MKFELGQRVQINNYLVRVKVPSKSVPLLAEYWADLSPTLLEEASRPSPWPRTVSTWVPERLTDNLDMGLRGLWLRRDNRNNPAPYRLALPTEGVIVQQVTLQDGFPDHDEYGSTWIPIISQIGYRVAYHLHRRPIAVLPSMIEPLKENDL